jgi:hypothetical protein
LGQYVEVTQNQGGLGGDDHGIMIFQQDLQALPGIIITLLSRLVGIACPGLWLPHLGEASWLA